MIRVLFVVDDPASLLSLRHSMAKLAHEWDLKFFGVVEEALASMSERPFDVVVADMSGSSLTGSELLALVQYQHPRVVRVLLAGDGEDNAVSKSAGVAHRILRKPCDPVELRCAIERVFDLEQRLNDPDLQAMIGEVGELPRPSAAVTRLNDVLASEDASVDNIATIISDDINMTAKLLQIVNSAYYGLAHHITEPREAVAYLGLNAVRDVVVANEMLRAFESVSPPVQALVDELHEHAIAVAHLARELMTNRNRASEAYVAALLHDVGLLLIASCAPDRFLELHVQTMRSSLSLREVEMEVIGAHHSDLGALLLDMWGLPSEIVEAVACHYDADTVPSTGIDAVHAVHIADVVVGSRAEGDSLRWKCEGELDEDYLREMGVADRIEPVTYALDV